MERESQRWGQQVLWYEFNVASVNDATDEDLYDEGGPQLRPGTDDAGTSRRWKDPKTVQVYMARLDEGAEDYDETGQYDVDRLTLVVNRQSLKNYGIDPTADHLNDRIAFDGRLFNVNHFDKRGRLADTYLTITVTCVEVKEDERYTDDATWYG
jgi:hypothetical protein